MILLFLSSIYFNNSTKFKQFENNKKAIRESIFHRLWWLSLHKRSQKFCSFKKRTDSVSTTKPPNLFFLSHGVLTTRCTLTMPFHWSKACKLYITIIHCDRVSLPLPHKNFHQVCWQCMASFDNVSVLYSSLSALFARSLAKQLSSVITLNPMLTRQIRSLDDGQN